MDERIKQLEQLKALADLMKSAKETKLAQARSAEQAVQISLSDLRSTRQAEITDPDAAQNAQALEGWLTWSRQRIGAEQAKQARHRAEVEMRLDDFKRAFGRSSAIDELLDRERHAQKQRRAKP